MNSNENPASQLATSAGSAHRARRGLIVIGVVSFVAMLPLILVAGCFRTEAKTRAVRDSLRQSMTSNGDWQTHIELHGGAMTLGLARFAASFIDDIPADVRPLLRSIRGADLGIYEFHGSGHTVDRAAYIEAATRSMDRQAWDRAVAVVDRDVAVMVFVARDLADGETLRGCVAVLRGRNLVIVSARFDPEPLIAFARLHVHDAHML